MIRWQRRMLYRWTMLMTVLLVLAGLTWWGVAYFVNLHRGMNALEERAVTTEQPVEVRRMVGPQEVQS